MHQKFKDENGNGNIIEIETRGERSVDKIYFRVKDVMEGFLMENLNKTIIDKKTYFVIGNHYKYFTCEKQQDILKLTFKKYLVIYNGYTIYINRSLLLYN